ncbi:MAG TPA: ribonucleotide reductase, partial [Xanthomarina gelatinilytica]|nr:ribonucleotide reductase [Xanthomarina gelatinilytica]
MSIFVEQISRKPDNYPWTEEFIQAMHNGFWTDKEFNFQSDVQDFKVHMTNDEREMVTRCLSAIAQIEVAVKTFWANVGQNLPHPSITDLGYVMANVEVIHNNAYERLIDILDMEDVFEKNLELPIIQNRVKYLRKYLHKYYKDSKKQYVYSLILFTLYVENVSLFSQFYTINYFNRFKNQLKDVSQQVAYTSREEMIHALVGIKLVNVIREEHPELFDEELVERIRSECVEAFKAEAKIIEWSVNGYESEHLSSPIMHNFIKHRLNESLKQIKIEPVFDDIDEKLLEKTQWFDEDVLGNTATDFFFKRPTEYSKKDKS